MADALVARMDAIPGLREPSLLRGLARLTRAKRTLVVATRDGALHHVKVEDNGTRLRAHVEALTLRNAYPAKRLEVDQTFRVEQIAVVAASLAHLSPAELRGMLTAGDDVVEAEIIQETGDAS